MCQNVSNIHVFNSPLKNSKEEAEEGSVVTPCFLPRGYAGGIHLPLKEPQVKGWMPGPKMNKIREG